jgi:hypothetical protein
MQQKWSEMPKLVTEEMVHAFAAVGTYNDIAAVMKKRFAGINRLDFEIPIRGDRERGVVREVIQQLRK